MNRALAFCALLALCACAGVRPEAPASARVVAPPAWRDGRSAGGDVPTDWWRSFDDPVLAQTVETALANNDDIAIAANRVEEARAQFDLARAQLLPSVGLAIGGDRERFLSPFLEPTYQTAGQGEVVASYELDLFGRLRSVKGAARARLLATEAARDNVRLAVAASAASGYVGLRSLDAKLVLLRDTLAARANSLQIAQRRAAAGYSSALELDQAEAEFRATEQQIPVVELAIARQEDGLSVLLGESPHSLERGGELSALALPSEPAMLPSQLLRRRPDIMAAEQGVVAADHSLDAARAAFMPSVQISAAGGAVASTLLDDPVGVFSAGGSVLAPIFEGGRLRAQARGAAARRDQAAFAYRRAALNAFREVEDALAAVQRTQEQERSLVAQREALAGALVRATNRYRAGYSSYLEQLDAQRGLLAADQAILQARADRLNAAIALYQALGGGWSRASFASEDTATGARANGS